MMEMMMICYNSWVEMRSHGKLTSSDHSSFPAPAPLQCPGMGDKFVKCDFAAIDAKALESFFCLFFWGVSSHLWEYFFGNMGK